MPWLFSRSVPRGGEGSGGASERAPRNFPCSPCMTFEQVPRPGSGRGGREGPGGEKWDLFAVGEGLPARFRAPREASRPFCAPSRGCNLGTSSKVMQFSKKKLR